MFGWWHRVKDGTLKRATFERRMPEVESEVVRLLEEAGRCASKKTAGMAREILKLKGALFTFVDVEGLEPTNNTAERALRPAVLWRKSSWGTHSPRGGLFVARMLTVVANAQAAAAQRAGVPDVLLPGFAARANRALAVALLSAAAPSLRLTR
ncbi:IS66 family transposase [Archangium sp.]|jgi:transposase|uniref:IS66 family transposase n=1 Tax=Archangium sp. TaxID=1872627 RepID=UPI0039C881DC